MSATGEAVETYARALFAQVDETHGDTWEETTEERRSTLRRLARESLESRDGAPLGTDEVRRLRGAIEALDWADLTETIAEHTREIATIRTLVARLIGGAS